MSGIIEQLVETTRVDTFIQRLRCLNSECTGRLEHDEKTRTENGMHGGPLEYRHICTKCGAGIWIRTTFPKMKYQEVVVEEVEDVKPVARTKANPV